MKCSYLTTWRSSVVISTDKVRRGFPWYRTWKLGSVFKWNILSAGSRSRESLHATHPTLRKALPTEAVLAESRERSQVKVERLLLAFPGVLESNHLTSLHRSWCSSRVSSQLSTVILTFSSSALIFRHFKMVVIAFWCEILELSVTDLNRRWLIWMIRLMEIHYR